GLEAAHFTLEVAEVLLRSVHSFDLIGDTDVYHAIRELHADRADLLGREHPEAATLHHRRAAHAYIGVGGRDHGVAAPEQRCIACEAASRGDADSRHQPAQLRETPECR